MDFIPVKSDMASPDTFWKVVSDDTFVILDAADEAIYFIWMDGIVGIKKIEVGGVFRNVQTFGDNNVRKMHFLLLTSLE